MGAALRYLLQWVHTRLNDSQVFALLDRLRQVNQHVLAHVQPDQRGEAGDGSGDVAKLVVSQAQVLQAMAVEQRSGKIFTVRYDGTLGVLATWAGLGCCCCPV